MVTQEVGSVMPEDRETEAHLFAREVIRLRGGLRERLGGVSPSSSRVRDTFLRAITEGEALGIAFDVVGTRPYYGEWRPIVLLVFRDEARVAAGVHLSGAHVKGRVVTPGRCWPELAPWRGRPTAKLIEKLRRWRSAHTVEARLEVVCRWLELEERPPRDWPPPTPDTPVRLGSPE